MDHSYVGRKPDLTRNAVLQSTPSLILWTCQMREALTHLHKVPEVLAARGEVEMTEERQPILPGASDLQVVRAPHVPEVRSVASCNNGQTFSLLHSTVD
jgi:hypothetical protein